MVKYISWVFAALLVGSTAAGAAELCLHPPGDAGQRQEQARAGEQRPGPPDKPSYKFWVNDKAALGITDQQATAIEQVWQSTLPKLRAAHENLDKLEPALSQMIRDAADESLVTAQIDKVVAARGDLDKVRTVMLYRMNRLLTADQREKLKAIHDRWEASKGPGGRR